MNKEEAILKITNILNNKTNYNNQQLEKLEFLLAALINNRKVHHKNDDGTLWFKLNHRIYSYPPFINNRYYR